MLRGLKRPPTGWIARRCWRNRDGRRYRWGRKRALWLAAVLRVFHRSHSEAEQVRIRESRIAGRGLTIYLATGRAGRCVGPNLSLEQATCFSTRASRDAWVAIGGSRLTWPPTPPIPFLRPSSKRPVQTPRYRPSLSGPFCVLFLDPKDARSGSYQAKHFSFRGY